MSSFPTQPNPQVEFPTGKASEAAKGFVRMECFSWLPDDLLLSGILLFLDGRDVARMGLLSKRFHHLCNMSNLWKNLCEIRWASLWELEGEATLPSNAPNGPHLQGFSRNPQSTDWKCYYRFMYLHLELISQGARILRRKRST